MVTIKENVQLVNNAVPVYRPSKYTAPPLHFVPCTLFPVNVQLTKIMHAPQSTLVGQTRTL